MESHKKGKYHDVFNFEMHQKKVYSGYREESTFIETRIEYYF